MKHILIVSRAVLLRGPQDFLNIFAVVLTPKNRMSGLEQEWSYDTGADDNAGQEEGGKGGPTKELVRVRGLCHMRGAILALVEW